MRIIVTIVTIFFLSWSSILAQFSSGTGTSIDPYEITTISELDSMRNHLDKNYLLMNDLDFEGTVYDSINSADSSTWVPIGDEGNPFRGTFNGNGKQVKNFYSYHIGNSTGIFGYTCGAEIKKLGIMHYRIKAWGGSAGALVGVADSSSNISECFAVGEIDASYNTGGLVGYLKRSTISKCYSSGKIDGTASLGGIVGQSIYASLITDCYSSAQIIGSSPAGGIVGYHRWESIIERCYTGSLIASRNKFGAIAGEVETAHVFDSFFDLEASTLDSSINGIPLTTEQMKQDSTFNLWDFDSVWQITPGITFPRLRGMYNVPFIQHTLKNYCKQGELYTDTVEVIQMDSVITSIVYHELPPAMSSNQYELSWPSIMGRYAIAITVEDGSGFTTNYSDSIKVHGYLGSGTEEKPFQIYSLAQLDSVRYLLDQNYILMNDLTYDGSTFGSLDTIYTEGWVPIGSKENSFSGIFDGNGHVIENLYQINDDGSYLGLFAKTYNASILNLGIVNCNMNGGYMIGSLIGCAWSTTISDCYATGSVKGDSFYAGGLVAQISSSEISNCWSSCSVQGRNYLGGLFGYCNNGSLTSSYATGNIYGGSIYGDIQRVGGLVGVCYSTLVMECFATGNVEGDKEVGGFVGYSSASIINCYSTGSAKGKERIGGFIGCNSSELKNSYSIGSSSGESYVGGFVGLSATGTRYVSCYYNRETSFHSDSLSATPTTIQLMMEEGTYEWWYFDTVWDILENSSYPFLRNVDNAPIAIADSIRGTLDSLLNNDFDFETNQENLLMHIDSIYSYSNKTNYNNVSKVSNGDSLYILYRVGEYRSTYNDTLWGNYTSSLLIYNNNIPVIKDVRDTIVKEDTPIQLSMDMVMAFDADGESLSLILYEGSNYTVNGTTVTPEINFNGELWVTIGITDGHDFSETTKMGITVTPVNDAPTMTNIENSVEISNDSLFSITLDMVNASDVDGDVDLSLILKVDTNAQVVYNSVIPNSGFKGQIKVSIAVSDGIDTSKYEDTMISVTSPTSIEILQPYEKPGNLLEVAPTPTKDSAKIGIAIQESGDVTLAIYSSTGRFLYQKIYTLKEGKSEIEWGKLSELSRGIYFMQMSVNGNQKAITRIVKIQD